jgi:D-alanyl-D-alanine carboxypeptidase (penicillin-binding protein 5/6)
MLEKDAHVKTDIASLTKIMTIIVSIENITDFNEEVEITGEMLESIEWDVSVAGFHRGDKVTYNDLLYGAMLPSGADATNALAISTAGSFGNFIDLMNKKVNDLGLKNTHFSNVVGLYDEENYSSAYDMAQILIYSLKNEKFKEVFETKTYTTTTGKQLKATLNHYGKDIDVSLIKGSKTGYIEKAGRCLASTASFNESDYVLVTLNAYSPEMSVHVTDSLEIYNYYKDNYSYHDYLNKEDIIVTLDTKTSKEDEVSIESGISKRVFYDNSFDKEKVEYVYKGEKEVSSFTEKGTKLGEVSVKYNGEEIDKFDLIYNSELTFSLKKYLFENIIIVIVGMFIIIKLFGIFKK